MRKLSLALVSLALPAFATAQETGAPSEDTVPSPQETAPEAAGEIGAGAPTNAPGAGTPAAGDHRGRMSSDEQRGAPQGTHQAGGGRGDAGERRMMHHRRMMEAHHGGRLGGAGAGSASISIKSGDRALRIECGDTPLPECVEGASPLIDLLR